MGYTHYYDGARFEPDEWLGLCRDVRKLIDEAQRRGIRVRGPLGTGYPAIGEGHIAFNGDADRGEDCETMLIYANPIAAVKRRVAELRNDPNLRSAAEHIESLIAQNEETGSVQGFVKTQYCPYDAVVTATLIRARHHNPTFCYDSDGTWADWQDGVELCRTLWPDDPVTDELGQPPKSRPATPSKGTSATRRGGQRRQPRGIPAGGQFASIERDEASPELVDPKRPNAGGTFHATPPPKNPGGTFRAIERSDDDL